MELYQMLTCLTVLLCIWAFIGFAVFKRLLQPQLLKKLPAQMVKTRDISIKYNPLSVDPQKEISMGAALSIGKLALLFIFLGGPAIWFAASKDILIEFKDPEYRNFCQFWFNCFRFGITV